MKYWLILTILIPIFSTSLFGAETSVEFMRGSLKSVQNKASQEGKLYFVDFTAKWCMPCRWMDQTTFSDPKLAKYVKENYLAVKVDIDDFDGFAYKEQYNVKMLPTIIIFNAKGEIVDRYSESLPPSRLIEILAKNDTKKNRIAPKVMDFGESKIISRPIADASPYMASNENNSFHNSTNNASSRNEIPHSPVLNAPILKIPEEYTSTASYVEEVQEVVPEFDYAEAKPFIPAVESVGLYRFTVHKQAASGFSVQVGAYAEYGNVLNEVSRFQEMTDREIIVHIAENGIKTVYKVMLGNFQNREHAMNYVEELKSVGIESIVKNLSQL